MRAHHGDRGRGSDRRVHAGPSRRAWAVVPVGSGDSTAAFLLVIYAGLSQLVDPHGYLGTDTGAKVATLDHMTETRTWWPRGPVLGRRRRPRRRRQPYYQARLNDQEAGWVGVTTVPMLPGQAALRRQQAAPGHAPPHARRGGRGDGPPGLARRLIPGYRRQHRRHRRVAGVLGHRPGLRRSPSARSTCGSTPSASPSWPGGSSPSPTPCSTGRPRPRWSDGGRPVRPRLHDAHREGIVCAFVGFAAVCLALASSRGGLDAAPARPGQRRHPRGDLPRQRVAQTARPRRPRPGRRTAAPPRRALGDNAGRVKEAGITVARSHRQRGGQGGVPGRRLRHRPPARRPLRPQGRRPHGAGLRRARRRV